MANPSRYRYVLRALEKKMLQSYLAQGKSIARTAELLEITTDRLYKRLRALGISVPRKHSQETPHVD